MELNASKYIEDNIWYIENDRWYEFFNNCPPNILMEVINTIIQSGIIVPDFKDTWIEFYYYDPKGEDLTIYARGLDVKTLTIEVSSAKSINLETRRKILCRNIHKALEFCNNAGKSIRLRFVSDIYPSKYNWVPVQTCFGDMYVSIEWLSMMEIGAQLHDFIRY